MRIPKFFMVLSLLVTLFTPWAAQAEKNLAVIVSGSELRPFWADVILGAQKAGEELGYQLYIRGTINDKDSEGQRVILNRFVDEHNSVGVVIAPSDPSRNKDVALLKARGIPTVYIDRDTGGVRVASVTTDNYAAGQLAAEKMSEALGGKGNVALFRLQEGVASTDARESGFIYGAKERGLKIVAEPYLGTRVGDARAISRRVLYSIDNLDGIFTPNDTTTIGTIIAREVIKKHKNVVHIGFDEDPFIMESLHRGKLEGYITQSPYEMGYQGVYAVHQALLGNESINNVNTPVVYIDE
ncbi:substrate-binding domain-containing protein [Vibrio albus]|nr:substrate-binding domain-containing protein [Vibrio albus]